MKAIWNIFLVVVLMGAAGAVGFYFGHRSAAASSSSDTEGADADDVKPVPTVQTAAIRAGHVDRTIVAYGLVTAQNSDVSVLSVPFESRVKKISVVAGQRLDSPATVIEIEPSADTRLQLLQAQSAAVAAKADYDQTQQRFTDHLATNQDLLQSRQNLQQAQLKLDSLDKAGATGALQLKGVGLIEKVDVQEGQVVPAGAPLLEIGSGAARLVRLGVEPSDAPSIHVGDPVSLQSMRSTNAPVQGKVLMVAQRIDPETHLSDVIASLPESSDLPLDAYVRGEFPVITADGLVVPRSAVLPDDDGYSIFTVDSGKALEHKVTIAAEDDRSSEVSGDGLSAGQSVVVVGNMELEDGMLVKAEAAVGNPSTADLSTPQPSTQEAAQ